MHIFSKFSEGASFVPNRTVKEVDHLTRDDTGRFQILSFLG